MKKIIVSILTVIALTVSLGGCVAVGLNGDIRHKVIVGEGQIVTKIFEVGELKDLSIKEVNARLHLSDSDTDEIRIELYENWAEEITVEVTESRVVIDAESQFRRGWKSDTLPQIYVSSKALESITVTGIVDFNTIDVITAESFTVNIMGIISGNLALDVKELTVDMSGVGDITLTGSAEKMTAESSGVGDLKAYGLVTKEAKVRLSGTGDMQVCCEENLDIVLSGVGVLRYKGNAAVTQSKKGVGNIEKVG